MGQFSRSFAAIVIATFAALFSADMQTPLLAQAHDAKAVKTIGPRYDVTEFGAVGDGKTDDTAAIQAAYTECTKNGGGTVDFPSPHSYLISATINLWHGCRTQGQPSGQTAAGTFYLGSKSQVLWNGPAAHDNISAASRITVAANKTSPLFVPSSETKQFPYQYRVEISASNNVHVGDWLFFSHCTAGGVNLNNLVAQVSTADAGAVTVLTDTSVPPGTYNNSCTVTQTSVMMAFDAAENHVGDSLTSLCLAPVPGRKQYPGVGILFAGRLDTGTDVMNVQTEGTALFGLYYAEGGLNIHISQSSRSDSAGIAQVYVRVPGNTTNNMSIADSQYGANFATDGQSGAAVMIDNGLCRSGQFMFFSASNVRWETDVSLSTTYFPLGVITVIGCPSDQATPETEITIHGGDFASVGSANIADIAVTPPNDNTVGLELSGLQLACPAAGCAGAITGIPSISRSWISGSVGFIPHFTYHPSAYSTSGSIKGASGAFSALDTTIADMGINRFFQYGINASSWLETDRSFTGLPTGTTLYPGQVLAPPAYFECGAGKPCGRYAIDVVQAPGTTGSLNAGATSCSSEGKPQMICSSATDLSPGQWVKLGSNAATSIATVDATNPGAVIVKVRNVQQPQSGARLEFAEPALGKEIQLPTKATAAPTAGTWSQGDVVWNSGAKAGGTAGWICVASGTPGSWVAIAAATKP